MSKYFFDTNALVKYYYQYELGSEVVKPLIQDEANKCFISNWGIIEFHSALGRIVRGNKLTKKQFYKVYLSTFYLKLFLQFFDKTHPIGFPGFF